MEVIKAVFAAIIRIDVIVPFIIGVFFVATHGGRSVIGRDKKHKVATTILYLGGHLFVLVSIIKIMYAVTDIRKEGYKETERLSKIEENVTAYQRAFEERPRYSTNSPFVSAAGEFFVVIPKGWKYLGNTNVDDTYFALMLRNERDLAKGDFTSFPPKMMFEVKKVPVSEASYEKQVSSLIDNFRKRNTLFSKKFKVLTKQRMTIANRLSAVYDCRIVQKNPAGKNVPVFMRIAVVAKGNLFVTIMYAYEMGKEKEFLPDVQALLASFRFLDDSARSGDGNTNTATNE